MKTCNNYTQRTVIKIRHPICAGPICATIHPDTANDKHNKINVFIGENIEEENVILRKNEDVRKVYSRVLKSQAKVLVSFILIPVIA